MQEQHEDRDIWRGGDELMEEQHEDRDIRCDRCHEHPIAYQLRDDAGEVDVRLCLGCYEWLQERMVSARQRQAGRN